MLMAVEQDDVAPGLPPFLFAVEAEAALIGAVLIDNRFFDRVVDDVSDDDFYEPVHGRAWRVIAHEIAAGRSVNPVLIRQFFECDPQIAELGGPDYFVRICSTASMIGARDFAKQIREKAKRRRLYQAMALLMERASKSPDSVRDWMDNPTGTSIESLVDDIDEALSKALGSSETAKSYSGHKAFDLTLEEIEAEAAGDAPPGLAVSGFDDWNELTGNIRRGEVVILAGRPSMGKTAVGLTTALASARAGWGTLFISLEMSVKELMKRAISDMIFDYGRSASFNDVKRGQFTHFDRERLTQARQQIEQWPITFRQDAGLRVGRLAMMVRRYKRQMEAKGKSLDVVFIDYLGLVRGDGKKQQRYEEVGEVSRTIKEIARELDVAIVVLAQLNREVERREDKRPQLSDLRDSGEIEQDADAVLFIYREEYYLQRSEPDPGDKKREAWEIAREAARDRVELIAAKVRNGSIGRRRCYFFSAHQAVRSSDFMSSGRGI